MLKKKVKEFTVLNNKYILENFDIMVSKDIIKHIKPRDMLMI